MTNAVYGYKKLRVWQEAHTLVLMVYKETKRFPGDELFGLTSQLRRSVVSVAANIIEGQARSSRKEFLQFLYVANGVYPSVWDFAAGIHIVKEAGGVVTDFLGRDYPLFTESGHIAAAPKVFPHILEHTKKVAKYFME